MTLWQTLLDADAQPLDSYAWMTNQCGHFVAGLFVFAALSWLPNVAFVVPIFYFCVWEVLAQNFSKKWDSAVDTAFVALGAGFMAAPFLAAVVTVAGLALGVVRREWNTQGSN